MNTQLQSVRIFLICICFFLFSFLFLNTPNLAADTFTVTNTNDSGPGSFRQAIIDANNNSGKDRIEFDIPGKGPHTIKPNSGLPLITDPVVIDGYSQRGARPNTRSLSRGINAKLKIEIDGSNVPGLDALFITAGNSVVRGLVINNCFHAITLIQKGHNVVEGNFIGTDVTGTSDRGNDVGIEMGQGSFKNRIGGRDKRSRNLISGNDLTGIEISGGASNNKIMGNFIGTRADGKVESHYAGSS